MPASQHPSPTLRDCVYGQAVGDALGVPYEFRARGTFGCTGMTGHGSHDQPAGTWSDDTSMALATCDSIRATGRGRTGDEVHAVSAITHAHATSCEACVRMVRVARRLIAGEGPRDVAGDFVGVPASRSGLAVSADTGARQPCRPANTLRATPRCARGGEPGGRHGYHRRGWREGSPASRTAWRASRASGSIALLGKATIDACLF